jgi:hypothetical protein
VGESCDEEVGQSKERGGRRMGERMGVLRVRIIVCVIRCLGEKLVCSANRSSLFPANFCRAATSFSRITIAHFSFKRTKPRRAKTHEMMAWSQKTHRHPLASNRYPPIVGPKVGPSIGPIPHATIAAPRLSCGKFSPIVAPPNVRGVPACTSTRK